LNQADVTSHRAIRLGQPEPHEETEEKQIKREGADTIGLDSGPVDTERWHRHP
jgi:hypothetical protein